MSLEDDESEITCLKKELLVSLAKNNVLEKDNQELRQEVARLRAQISSLKAHDNERKSMLWKKLQNPNESCNTDATQQKTSDFVKISELRREIENSSPQPNFQDLAAKKERASKIPKPPLKPPAAITTSIKEVNENESKEPSIPVPPPPPLPSKLLVGSKSVRRVPEVVQLYRLLTRKDSHLENRNNHSANPAPVFAKNMIGEIENRSSYLSAIKSDVERKKEFINFLINEVESAAHREISEVETFVKWLDKELSSLVDERAVLKHFPQWPERKADALREAAFNYRDLQNLESEVSSFEDNPKESLVQALGRIQGLQDRLEESVNNMERMRDSKSSRYREMQIPWEWMLETGLIGQMKLSSLRLARAYMKRITKELQSSRCPSERNLMLQGVRFTYRVHQFAGGFDGVTIRTFEELKKVGMGMHKQ
ncbi:protein CHUP1, chloroplastic isoform X2 [Carica papaya]|uniref:protein CHUP1, chloroplastic isoform X2 n=1 Tax=Carica papaya TaxID=3649 RepID=UPI000B8C8147|nr:protein CHUP1, chloroplastic isoform X2 [Carica papaya]